jgi:tRNA 2-thiouridine synthesizing protein D
MLYALILQLTHVTWPIINELVNAMLFSLAVYGAPYSHQCAESAYQFAKAAVEAGHGIYRIFFYQDGVYNASALTTPPQDEQNIPERWVTLAEAHQIDLVVCVAAALRRGMLNEEEADRFEKPVANVHSQFTISGLGQLIDAGVHSDRLITFAP